MDIHHLLNPKTAWVLLFLAVGLEAATLLVYFRLDNIVHVDLYKYGLSFNLAWAQDYWNSYGSAMGCMICSNHIYWVYFGPVLHLQQG